jgi:hypothetical protein
MSIHCTSRPAVALFAVLGALLACRTRSGSRVEQDAATTGRPSAVSSSHASVSVAADADSENLPAVELTSKQLLREFRDDPKAAKRRYGGRWLRVSGELLRLSPGILAADAIDVGPHGSDVLEDDLIACRFPEEVEEPLKGLKVGSRVVILGRMEGSYLDRVRLEECRLVGGAAAADAG